MFRKLPLFPVSFRKERFDETLPYHCVVDLLSIEVLRACTVVMFRKADSLSLADAVYILYSNRESKLNSPPNAIRPFQL
jgi:hypothetical protein